MKYFFVTLTLTLCISCSNLDSMTNQKPPKPHKEAKELSIHGDTRIDNYFWMRLSDKQKESKIPDQQTKKVIDYLNAENAYLKHKMHHTTELQNNLFNDPDQQDRVRDMAARIRVWQVQTGDTAPIPSTI